MESAQKSRQFAWTYSLTHLIIIYPTLQPAPALLKVLLELKGQYHVETHPEDWLLPSKDSQQKPESSSQISEGLQEESSQPPECQLLGSEVVSITSSANNKIQDQLFLFVISKWQRFSLYFFSQKSGKGHVYHHLCFSYNDTIFIYSDSYLDLISDLSDLGRAMCLTLLHQAATQHREVMWEECGEEKKKTKPWSSKQICRKISYFTDLGLLLTIFFPIT